MLGNSGGDSLITKLTSYLTAETVSTTNNRITPSVANSGPNSSRIKVDDNVHSNQASGSTDSNHRGVVRQTLQRSTSDNISVNQKRKEHSGASSLVVSRDEHERIYQVHDPNHKSLKPPRPSAHRCASSPIVRSHNHYHDPNMSVAALKQALKEQTKFPSHQPSASTPPYPVSNARNVPSQNASRSIRHIVTRSASCRDQNNRHTKSSSSDLPLKPCIKLKSESTPTSPPGGRSELVVEDGNQTLRRVKTVDFDENGSKQSIILPKYVAMGVGGPPEKPEVHRTSAKVGQRPGKKIPSWPLRLGVTKSSPADPAVTRTDVHVIAIAPSVNAADYSNEDCVDPATPTMQVTESKTGRQEIVWDDVPLERSIGCQDRTSSSAGQALEMVGCHGKRGLDRVNTKLTDWSGTWNSPSSSFKPTIVVFPDDDTWAPHYDCAIEDDEDLTVLAPPNSQRTSAGPSRHQSRPSSAPLTRASSYEEAEPLQVLLPDPSPTRLHSRPELLDQSLAVPDPNGRQTRTTHIKQKRTQGPALRKLSNIEDADLRFRGHRNSVTIAHSRLVRTGGESLDLFAHRDVVSVARKRMYARNHATRKILQADGLSLHGGDHDFDNDSDDDGDDDTSVISFDTSKEHALQALKKSSSASMLHVQGESGTKRHIHIVD
ncbi:hypothetical protein J1614_006392 [Plenodomus biglobosus]|nr:hypothetical protein J1614_006392 [Plenodomus biglobosus]